MPIDYHIDKARKLVVTTATGRVTDAELLNIESAVHADPDFDASFRAAPGKDSRLISAEYRTAIAPPLGTTNARVLH